LELKIYNLTKDKIDQLKTSLKNLSERKAELLETTNLTLYTQELESLWYLNLHNKNLLN